MRQLRVWVARRDVLEADDVQEENDGEDLDDVVHLPDRLDLVPLVRDEARPPDGHRTALTGVLLQVCGLGRLAVRPFPVQQEDVNCHLSVTDMNQVRW